MQTKQDSRCCKELSSVELSDKRLNRRLLKVASDLLNHPGAPIREACSNRSGAKAAYRYLIMSVLDRSKESMCPFSTYFSFAELRRKKPRIFFRGGSLSRVSSGKEKSPQTTRTR